jgi:anaerobic selenocysteine-containing dehydrogenase
VNHSRLGEALLEMGSPPIRSLFVAGNNPAVTCPDAGAVRQGLMRENLFTVVHDPFLSDTARYADIVLPATTYLETDDFYRSYGTYRMQYGPAAIAPVGHAWSNRRLAQELAKRMDITDPLFSMDTEELLTTLIQESSAGGSYDAESLMHAGSVKVSGHGEAQRFGTSSGKLEFWPSGSSTAVDWRKSTIESTSNNDWPLRLLTAPGYFQSHAAFAGNGTLRQREGSPVCVLHPTEATSRGLNSGDQVELFNCRGVVTLQLKVSTDAPIGVALVPGQQPEYRQGDGVINMLCSSEYSDMGEGATYQSTFLDVRASARTEPPS